MVKVYHCPAPGPKLVLKSDLDVLTKALVKIGKQPCINKFGFCPSCHAKAALEKIGFPVDAGAKP